MKMQAMGGMGSLTIVIMPAGTGNTNVKGLQAETQSTASSGGDVYVMSTTEDPLGMQESRRTDNSGKGSEESDDDSDNSGEGSEHSGKGHGGRPDHAGGPHKSGHGGLPPGLMKNIDKLPDSNPWKQKFLAEQQAQEEEQAGQEAAPVQGIAVGEPVPPGQDPNRVLLQDPDTGLLIDPATGEVFDPNTGAPVDPRLLGPQVDPLTASLINPEVGPLIDPLTSLVAPAVNGQPSPLQVDPSILV